MGNYIFNNKEKCKCNSEEIFTNCYICKTSICIDCALVEYKDQQNLGEYMCEICNNISKSNLD